MANPKSEIRNLYRVCERHSEFRIPNSEIFTWCVIGIPNSEFRIPNSKCDTMPPNSRAPRATSTLDERRKQCIDSYPLSCFFP